MKRWHRPLIKTLDAYVLKRFLSIYVANLASFTFVFVVIDTVTHAESFFRPERGFWGCLQTWFWYYAMVTPVIYCQILGPVVSLSAALFAVTTLQRSNEFTPILATGRSYQRTLLPVVIASVFVSGAVFLVQEVWIPRTFSSIRKVMEALERKATMQNVKHFDTARGNLIVFKEYEPLYRKARGVLVLPVFSTGGHQFLIHARSAEWRKPDVSERKSLAGYWLLTDGWVQEWDETYRLIIRDPEMAWPDSPPRLSDPFAERKLESNLIPEDIEKKEMAHMTLADLRRKARTSPDQSVWTIRYYSRFAYAGTNFTLVILGIPIIVFFGNRNIIFGALLSVAIATAYFVVNSVCQDLGIQGYFSAALGGCLATLLFVSLGLTLYRSMRS